MIMPERHLRTMATTLRKIIEGVSYISMTFATNIFNAWMGVIFIEE